MSRRVIVTGAASGIGARIAHELIARGDRVCAADLNTATMEALRSLASTKDQLRIEKLDVRDPVAWERVVDGCVSAWGSIDVLLNVAGVLRVGNATDIVSDDVHFHLDINTKGVIFGTQAAIRVMLPQQQGHIVNIASLAALTPVPGLSLYCASKFAVRGYSLSVAQELRPHGIKVSVVCPDAVQTPMLDIQANDERAALTFSGNRSLTADEVAQAVIDEVLVKAPIELALPRYRGSLAKIAGAAPQLAMVLVNTMRQRGIKRQRKERSQP
jgi:3-oxoacyl-[acyl-carrier protein] reductase